MSEQGASSSARPQSIMHRENREERCSHPARCKASQAE